MMEPNRDALIIRIAKTLDRLGMSAFYNSKSADFLPYSEVAASEKDISASWGQIADILSKGPPGADPRGAALLAALTAAGRQLFEIIFTQEIKSCIRKAR